MSADPAPDAAADAASVFSGPELVAKFSECMAAADSIPHAPFLDGCAEVEKLLCT